MSIVILYGTESGNAELVAGDLADAMPDREVAVEDMSVFEPEELEVDTFYLFVCSTHGDGELPSGALPFWEELDAIRPSLEGYRYGMFGMGDTTYSDTYSQGSEHIDRLMTELGAQRVGEYGRHDASSRQTASDAALAWLPGLLAALEAAGIDA